MNKILVIVLLTLFLLAGISTTLILTKRSTDYDKAHQHELEIVSERTFLEHMIPHHEEAVELARTLLERDVRLRPISELAEKIIINQVSEIEMMKTWYETWYQVSYPEIEYYQTMMRDLAAQSSGEAERVFLEDMILHHESAVTAAKKVLLIRPNLEIETLANNIILTQEQEIFLMKQLLTLLPK